MKKTTKLVLKWIIAIVIIGLILIIAKNWQGFIDGFYSV